MYPSVERGVMKRSKKQPTRDDLAAAWKTIRDQSQIISLQAEKIRRLEQAMGDVLRAYPRLEEFRVNYSQLFFLFLGDCICAYGSRDSGDVDYFKLRAGGGCARLPWYGTTQRTNQAHGANGQNRCMSQGIGFCHARTPMCTNIRLETR
jgi:hypothetical protein